MSLITQVRVIDHQERPDELFEVVEGPDLRRVRFIIRVGGPTPHAYSQVWQSFEWKMVHHLLKPGTTPEDALARLFKATEDILGWSAGDGGCPST